MLTITWICFVFSISIFPLSVGYSFWKKGEIVHLPNITQYTDILGIPYKYTHACFINRQSINNNLFNLYKLLWWRNDLHACHEHGRSWFWSSVTVGQGYDVNIGICCFYNICTRYLTVGAKTCGLTIRKMCPSWAICWPADCCFTINIQLSVLV